MGRTTLQSFVNIEQLVRYCRNHGLKKNAIVLKKMAMEENFVNNFFLITPFINYYRNLARLNHRSNAAKGPCSLLKLLGAGYSAMVCFFHYLRLAVMYSYSSPILCSYRPHVPWHFILLLIPERNCSDIGGIGNIYLKCSHVTWGARETRRTWTLWRECSSGLRAICPQTGNRVFLINSCKSCRRK